MEQVVLSMSATGLEKLKLAADHLRQGAEHLDSARRLLVQLGETSEHVGRRTAHDANIFAAKLSAAVSADRFQISTDGFEGYPAALEQHLGGQIDYAQLIKSYSGDGLDSERRYSRRR
jgi:hypothetical protein